MLAAKAALAPPSTNPFGFVDGGGIPVLAFADLDGDGDLDGFVGEYRGRLLYFVNVSLDPDACADGLDNDGDGRIDAGAGNDPGCASINPSQR